VEQDGVGLHEGLAAIDQHRHFAELADGLELRGALIARQVDGCRMIFVWRLGQSQHQLDLVGMTGFAIAVEDEVQLRT
jgi:hypothetical protein